MVVTGNLSYAEDSVYLNQKDPAPFSGYLLPEGTVKTLRNNTLERDSFKTLNESYQTTIGLQQKNLDLKGKEVDLLLNQNLKLMSAATEDHSLNTWEKVAFFAGGVLLTGFAIWGVHEVYK